MKTKTKALVLALCAVLLVVTTVFTTVALLTSTDSVKNTFTVGKVNITLDEAGVDQYGKEIADAARVEGNEYKLIPGHTYVKDPTIHVAAGSENVWVFAKIENDLGDDITIAMENGWTLVEGETNVYAYNSIVSAGKDVVVFKSFTTKSDADFSAVTTDDAITVTGYAVQADGFDSAAAAWTASGLD